MKIEHKFEYTWGGEDNWYTKSKRWANKQNPVVKHLALGVIEWLWVKWIAGKVKMEMASVDKQAKDIVEQWEQEEAKQFAPEIKVEPSEVEGLDNISISYNKNGTPPEGT